MQFKKVDSKYYFFVLYIIFCGFVVVYMNSLLTQKPIRSDAEQNLWMAYNLYNHGTLAIGDYASGTMTPTNYREPVTPIVSAFFMYVHPEIEKSASFASFFQGENTKKIKQVNLFWIVFLLTGIGCLLYIVSKNEYAPFLGLLFVLIYFIRFGNHFDTLYTELQAATLIIWSTLLLVITVKEQTPKLYLFTGLSLGILILTKAVFFYLFIVVVFFLIIFGESRKKPLKIALLLLGVFILVGPWLARNYNIYKEISITQRGGSVLHTRALKNQITREEIKGAVYFWGPEVYKNLVKNTALGVREGDFESGGKYVRLNRELEKDTLAVDLGLPHMAESFFKKSRAEINRLQNELGTGGKEGSRREAYIIMKSQAMEMILDQPFKHLSMSALFLWRGVWCFPNSTIPFLNNSIQRYLHDLVNLVSYLSLLGFFCYGFFKRNTTLLALTILPVSMLLFHALITHNIPRFSEPVIPSMLVCLSLFILSLKQEVFKNYIEKYKNRSKNRAT